MARHLLAALPGFVVVLFSASAAAEPPAPTYHLVKQIRLGGEGGWDYLAVDPEAHRLYITRSNRVMVVDLDTEKVVGEVANTRGVHGVALAPKLGRGFTSNGGDSTVTVFDLKTLAEVDRIKVGNRPDAILYDPASGRVFTLNAGSRDTTAIDAASGKVVGAVKLGGKPEFAAADGKGQVYVNIENRNEVVALDAQRLEVKSRWPVAPGQEPAGLAIDPGHRRLFSTCHNRMMIVLDADSGRVVAQPAIGRGTDACAFDPGAGLAFSSNGDGTLTIVQEETPDQFRVVANVRTQPGARTMALDPRTHTVYLVTARAKPAPAGARGERRRPSYEPGSFVVLVVAP